LAEIVSEPGIQRVGLQLKLAANKRKVVKGYLPLPVDPWIASQTETPSLYLLHPWSRGLRGIRPSSNTAPGHPWPSRYTSIPGHKKGPARGRPYLTSHL